MMVLEGEANELEGPLRWVIRTQRTIKAAVTGASHLKPTTVLGRGDGGGGGVNSRCLSFAEGRRGTQERNCISSSFMSFICCSV